MQELLQRRRHPGQAGQLADRPRDQAGVGELDLPVIAVERVANQAELLRKIKQVVHKLGPHFGSTLYINNPKACFR